jgi:hypothetical protein
MDFTNTPLGEPLPDDPIERVHRFARDLAWGALNGHWTSSISVIAYSSGEDWISFGRDNAYTFDDYFNSVWQTQYPEISILIAFAYVVLVRERESGQRDYALTPKAFALLAKPLTPPTVFISYRRSISSALGLLLVSRLKAVGIPNPFIDMNIDPGDEWHAQLEKIVRDSRYFILLIGKATLESEYVKKEIEWALDTPDMVIIPFLHDGVREDVLSSVGLQDKQAIVVQNESAEEYEIRVIKLLNRLGYTP